MISHSLCTAIASDVTILRNLQGISNRVNGFKNKIMRGALGKGGPATTNLDYFGHAVHKNLMDNQATVESIMNNLGDKLSSIGDNDANLKAYFISVASARYSNAIAFAGTWSGPPYSRPAVATSTITPSPATSLASASATPTQSCSFTVQLVDNMPVQYTGYCICNIGPTPSPTSPPGGQITCPTT